MKSTKTLVLIFKIIKIFTNRLIKKKQYIFLRIFIHRRMLLEKLFYAFGSIISQSWLRL